MKNILVFALMAIFMAMFTNDLKAQTTCPSFRDLVNLLSCSTYNPPLECVCTFELKPSITSLYPVASVEVDGVSQPPTGFTLSNTSILLVKFQNNLICEYNEDDYDWCD